MKPEDIPAEDMVNALVLPCCGLLVPDYYVYCPKCGEKIDRSKCEKKEVPYFTVDWFDYANWMCPCGKGYERMLYDYCPVWQEKNIKYPRFFIETGILLHNHYNLCLYKYGYAVEYAPISW